MDMGKTVSDLLENEFGITFLKFTLSFDQPEKISTACILHDHQEMFARFKNFQEPDNIRMLNLFQQVDLLEHLSFTEIVLHIVLLNCLDSDLFTGQFMDTQSDFSEGSFANKFDEFVKVQSCWWKLIILLDILFNVLDQLVPFLKNGVVYLGCGFTACNSSAATCCSLFTRVLNLSLIARR